MGDRNTAINRGQLKPIRQDDFDATNSPSDNYVPSYDEATGKFTWVAITGGVSNLPDLGDVDFDTGTPNDNDVLTYDLATGKWKAEAPTGGAEQLSDLTDVGVTTPTNKNVLIADGDSWESRALVEADISDLDHYDSTDFDTDFAGKDLDDLSDGSVYKRLKVDDFTIKESSNIIKIADRIELNTMLIAFRLSVSEGFIKFNMVDGFIDEYEDESGIDTGDSSGQTYDSSNDYYKPTPGSPLEIDYCEYSTDELAQSAYVSNAIGVIFIDDFNSYDDGDIVGQGNWVDAGWQDIIGNIQGVLVQEGTKAIKVTGTKTDTSLYWTVKKTGIGTTPGNIEIYMRADVTTQDLVFRLYEGDTKCIDTYFHDFGSGGEIRYHTGGSWVQYLSSYSADTWYRIQIEWKGSGESSEYRFRVDDGSWTDYVSPTADWTTNLDTVWLQVGVSSVGTLNAYFDNITGTIDLQCYSEDGTGLFTQGSYSLKVIALQTESLDDTLTNTFGTGNNKDLSGINSIKFDIYASRVGTNIQLQIHDSGGTTSTKDIVIATGEEDTWKTITWDISGISDANKDDIDWIKIKIINADSANTFYIDNIYAEGEPTNMILISEVFNAEADPDTARIVLFEQDVDSITVGTDIKAYISRDDGVTWAEVTLADEGDYDNNIRILSGVVDLTQTGIGSATGYPVRYKVTTHNQKNLYLHGTGVNYS